MPLLELDDLHARELPALSAPWEPTPAPRPDLLHLNRELAAEVGLDVEALATPHGAVLLAGGVLPEGATPVSQAYAGHQFGSYSPRLGDGRAVLLGEVVAPDGRRLDLHLKGSGRTTWARGGDGRASLGPMLREVVVAEAMHALGVPTTRSLAVVTTGETVVRQRGPEPGAVLARLASSHLRVGTFQYAARLEDAGVLADLADHAIRRHHPRAAEAAQPPLALLDAVVGAQARLVASWMLVGFVHGVMNTDNIAISGETIDYGPCAFLDAYDPAAVFSSIDHGGRYAYGNQPRIMLWNLARFGESLLPLVAEDPADAVAPVTEVLETFEDRYDDAFLGGMCTKLGLDRAQHADDELRALVADRRSLLEREQADWTRSFRVLSALLRGEDVAPDDRGAVDGSDWLGRWRGLLDAEGRDPHAVADDMDRTNPLVIPRNHLVEEALDAAIVDDLAPFRRLLAAVTHPFDEPADGRDAQPAPPGFQESYTTFCGT